MALHKLAQKLRGIAVPHPLPKNGHDNKTYRGGKCLVSLPHLKVPRSVLQCNAQRKTETRDRKKTPPKKTDTDRTRTSKHRTGNERRRRKGKKTGAGQCLGVGEEEDVRIEGGERVQVEETQREPQTKKVWGSPAPEREREREREREKENTRRRRTNHTRKKEETGK